MPLTHKQQLLTSQTQARNTTFKDMYKTVTYGRSATDGVFDAVTETYTGGSPPLSETLQGMFRKVKTDLQDGVNIVNTDSMLSILQAEMKTSTGTLITPLENDTVLDPDGKTWRVVRVLEDPAEVFWQLIIRRV